METVRIRIRKVEGICAFVRSDIAYNVRSDLRVDLEIVWPLNQNALYEGLKLVLSNCNDSLLKEKK
jgi:hypothetical protein